ncbi:DNA polymerase III subunit delta [Sandaracinomonas limnophila]|uniref:DNA polymerase III subunit delta n=1 Tax=Sandaracinomonas limnophila TaxID=1862386 RepID=A0A437PWB2_9BACT|nr:DNA polymerase III subunit delta [Sandaracinomonas limnophila]RVU26540.1 DNA polymerase III subunit delta [Sandaracinomonas limnophila]
MNKSPQEVLKDIKSKNLAPIYIIHGDEPYFIDLLTDSFEANVLDESEKGFNQFIFYGKDQTLAAILSNARRFPMMAERQVILVKEASFLESIGKGKSDSKDKGIDDLKLWEEYLKNPMPSTLLVFTVKTALTDKAKIFSSVKNQAVVVSSPKVKEDKVAAWLKDYLLQNGLQINPETLDLMVSFVGTDLKRIAFEADKLIINLPKNTVVGSEEVEKYIGLSKEYNYFELQKAIAYKDVAKASKIAFHFAQQVKQNPIAPCLIQLFNFFTKVLLAHDAGNVSDSELAREIEVNPYFVRDYVIARKNYSLPKVVQILEQIKNADLKFKGILGNPSEADLWLDLSFAILH